jgi:hypothetical protein
VGRLAIRGVTRRKRTSVERRQMGSRGRECE